MEVIVVDVRCGSKLDKVMVCHNGNTICVDANAVPAHLGNHASDYIGACDSRAIVGGETDNHDDESEMQHHASAMMNAYPNPFTSTTTIDFTLGRTQNVQLEVFDLKGSRVAVLFNGEAKEGITNSFVLDGTNLKADIYFARLVTESEVKIVKLAIVR